MLTELKTLAYLLRDWFVLWVGVAALVFTCGVRTVAVGGYAVPVPWFEGPSLAARLLDWIATTLAPAGVPLIVTTPFAAFVATAKVALLAALVVTVPYGLYRLARYVAPALRRRERRLARLAVIPAGALFGLGCWFAYRYVIPPTLALLYGYAAGVGAEAYLELAAFVSVALGLMAAVGIMFTLPVVMALLASRSFWLAHWRGAVVTFLVVSAILTPDGSGITMVLLAAPMTALYGAGIVASRA